MTIKAGVINAVLACIAITASASPAAAAPASAGEVSKLSGAKASTPWLLTGKVTSADGQPVDGATVSAKLSGGPLTISVYTDESGRYYFPAFAQGGSYVVTAQLAGYQRALATLLLAGGLNRVDLQLSEPAEILRQLPGWQQLARLPDDTREDRRGKAILLKSCSGCHQTSRIFARRFDEHGWSAMIDAMASLTGGPEGTLGPQPFKQELAKYLARVAGPVPVKLKSLPIPRPEGDARNAVIYEYAISTADGRYGFGTGDWSEGNPIVSGIGLSIHDAALDHNGNPWFSAQDRTTGRTISSFDRDTGKLTSYAFPGDAAGFSSQSHGLVTARDGKLWLTNARGPQLLFAELAYIDPVSKEFRSYPVPKGRVPVGGWLNEDGLGAIWTSTGAARGREGVWRFEPKTGEFEQYKSISEGLTYGVAGDRQGNAWWAQINVDTMGYVDRSTGQVGEIKLPFTWQGAAFLKPGDMSQDEYLKLIQGVGGLPGGSQMPRRIRADLQADVVWVANFTGNNLMSIDTRTKQIEFFPAPADGMNPYDVGIDSSHRVWVGMQNADEIARFDPESKKWTIYPLPTRGTSPRSIVVIEREGNVEMAVPANDAHKVVRLVHRTDKDVAALKQQYSAHGGK